MIKCTSLSVGYRDRPVLSDLNFTLKGGEITALLGKNGSGKSTMLRALSGNQKYSGSIVLEHAGELCTLSAKERAARIALMPQMMHAPHIPVRRLVSFGRQPHTGLSGILSEQDKQIVEQALLKAGVAELAEKSVAHISGGERQKAYFAMMLAQQASVWLLDEPCSHLDAAYSRQIAAVLKGAAEDGKTVLTVEHDINRAVETADRILVLHDGRLCFNGSVRDFLRSEIPETVFSLRRLKAVAPDGTSTVLFR